MIKYFIVYKDFSSFYLVIGDYSDVQKLLEFGYTVVPVLRMSVDEIVFEECDFNG